eukprot:TRINITY_DN33336_c0_g1_i1.p1 TRINITY_DN33336_c0_g1~~TRINITY_DN33336_c0_g1_i1.p1  ORF type:complete len:1164 (+),score=258.15 TRINITY_DN33336_c0_g1_i1:126-3617(+)
MEDLPDDDVFDIGSSENDDDEEQGDDVVDDTPQVDEVLLELAEAAEEISGKDFKELKMPKQIIAEVRKAWNAFTNTRDTVEEIADLLYLSIFESSPSLQNLFTTPKAVQAMRFLEVISSFIDDLDKPAALKAKGEALAFRHLSLEVTEPRANIFRESIIDLISMELADDFTQAAQVGLMMLLGWIGGAHIYFRHKYSDRLAVLNDCWQKVTNSSKSSELAKAKREAEAAEAKRRKEAGASALEANDWEDDWELASNYTDFSGEQAGGDEESRSGSDTAGEDQEKTCCGLFRGSRGQRSLERQKSEGASKSKSKTAATFVPTTFTEMFDFNAQVMGFGSGGWLQEILVSFDVFVNNVANIGRLQEECDVCVLRIGKVAWLDDVNLAQFKACMLAALRSLLPKEWDSSYEVAWNWMWDNVQHLLESTLGKTLEWENELYYLMDSFDEEMRYELRSNVYDKFFIAAPAGQEYFKQSDTRLHFIAEKVFQFTTELFADPWQVADDLSALGLRHVGYGVPVGLFPFFITACVEVIATVADSDQALEAFRWSLALIAKQLTRTITEGSTIVMKAVNANSQKQLVQALKLAPRGKRSEWLLKVQVGSHSISPLFWAIESGNLAAAEQIIKDLLAIRADRERYYFGVDDMFLRHQDIASRICREAPTLIWPLLDGLCWRSRRTSDGLRRANYYIQHLIINQEGEPAEFLRELCSLKDPKIMCHAVVVVVSDTLWTGVVSRQFLLSRVWFIISLAALMLGQAILPKNDVLAEDWAVRFIIFLCRTLNYLMTMCRLMIFHFSKTLSDARNKRIQRVLCIIPLPHYLRDVVQLGSLSMTIMLMLMCINEPMYHCWSSDPDEFPTYDCEGVEETRRVYSAFAMAATWMHWALMVDFAVFNTGLSAFVLVCAQVFSELGRFVVALVFLLMAFGSGIAVLEHGYFGMRDIPNALLALFSITVLLFEDDYRNFQYEPALFMCVFTFAFLSSVLLMNLLIAQLNNTYNFVNQDMVGFARLNRATVIVDTVSKLKKAKWVQFIEFCKFNEPLEFNEGDVGVPGGIQVLEPAKEHVVEEDTVIRYGGICSGDMQWPEDSKKQEAGQLEQVEALAQAVFSKVTKDAKERRRQKENPNSEVDQGFSKAQGSSDVKNRLKSMSAEKSEDLSLSLGLSYLSDDDE